MSRKVKIAAAQVGAIDRTADRQATLERLKALLRQASSHSVRLVVFPEITLTTFFPRHLFHTQSDLDTYFESGDPLTSSNTAPLFGLARELNIDIVLGFAERAPDGKGYNTCVYYSAPANAIVSKYRKVHLPGTKEPFEDPAAINQLEKRYFTPGDLGFKAFRAPDLVEGAMKAADVLVARETGEEPDEAHTVGRGDPVVGMLICNDRRWSEAWRVLTLQGAEIVVFGHNTGGNMAHLWGRGLMTPERARKEALFHSRLVQQANSYMNACFSVSAARCGFDDGKYDLIGGSCIISPEGHVLAEARTDGDELVVAECDLEECRVGKEKTFDYARHRRIEHYGLISSQTGVIEPDLL